MLDRPVVVDLCGGHARAVDKGAPMAVYAMSVETGGVVNS